VLSYLAVLVFFFQAEDGIRDFHVTGVQTCALPISALPEADVVSLITTGSLSNSESGLPTLAQSGINTAAEVITDSIINNPARKEIGRASCRERVEKQVVA